MLRLWCINLVIDSGGGGGCCYCCCCWVGLGLVKLGRLGRLSKEEI